MEENKKRQEVDFYISTPAMCDMTISPQEMHKALSDEIWGPEEQVIFGHL